MPVQLHVVKDLPGVAGDRTPVRYPTARARHWRCPACGIFHDPQRFVLFEDGVRLMTGAEIKDASRAHLPGAAAAEVLAAVPAFLEDDLILDIGPDTAQHYAGLIAKAGTVVWNGPVGVFEFDAFGKGTEILAHAIADSKAFSIAGGGDTLAAVDKYGVEAGISYISTGGGAFLEFCEGKELPAVAALKARAN